MTRLTFGEYSSTNIQAGESWSGYGQREVS